MEGFVVEGSVVEACGDIHEEEAYGTRAAGRVCPGRCWEAQAGRIMGERERKRGREDEDGHEREVDSSAVVREEGDGKGDKAETWLSSVVSKRVNKRR